MFGIFFGILWLVFQAAILWFIIVFVTQMHHVDFWNVRVQFILYYIASVIIAVLVGSMFENEILKLLISRGIIAVGLGLMLYLHHIPDLKKIAIILAIFFTVTTALLMGRDALFNHNTAQSEKVMQNMMEQE